MAFAPGVGDLMEDDVVEKVARGDGYSLPYRIWWEIEYTLLHVFGPASLDGDADPRIAMKKDHDRRKALWLERKAARR